MGYDKSPGYTRKVAETPSMYQIRHTIYDSSITHDACFSRKANFIMNTGECIYLDILVTKMVRNGKKKKKKKVSRQT